MVIFIYGEDTYRSRQKLKEFKDKFMKEVDASGNSIVSLDGDGINMEKLSEMLGTSSLFARKRMIIIERITKNKDKSMPEKIADYLKENFSAAKNNQTVSSTDNIIVFWDEEIDEKKVKNQIFDYLSKQAFVYKFKKLSNTEAIDWIKKEIDKKGLKIKNQAAINLSSLFGSDLWQLNNEVDKLIHYKLGQGSESNQLIDENDVFNIVRGNVNEDIFALTDAIASKNKQMALTYLENEIAAGVAEINLLNMINWQFRILLLVRQCLDKGYTSRKITSLLKIHPFLAQKGMNQARRFSLNYLRDTLKKLIVIDYKIKTGQGSPIALLSLLITEM